MLLAAPNKITYEEFLEWINEERHAEWVDGEIIEMSPVSNQHQDVVRRRIWTDSRKHLWKAGGLRCRNHQPGEPVPA